MRIVALLALLCCACGTVNPAAPPETGPGPYCPGKNPEAPFYKEDAARMIQAAFCTAFPEIPEACGTAAQDYYCSFGTCGDFMCEPDIERLGVCINGILGTPPDDPPECLLIFQSLNT